MSCISQPDGAQDFEPQPRVLPLWPQPTPSYLARRFDIPALRLLEFTEASLEEAAAALGYGCRERDLSQS